MKGKVIHIGIIVAVLLFPFSITNSYNSNGSIDSFVNSPSIAEIETIEDRIERVCEQAFLEAYMRRDFTNRENMLCSDIFSLKIEAEMNYKYKVLGERGVY